MREVKIFSPPLQASYLELLRTAEGAMFTHSLEFKSFLEKLLPNAESKYLCLTNDGVLEAVMPVFSLEWSGKEVLNSLPFYGSHGGVLTRVSGDVSAEICLLEEFERLTNESAVASATIVESPLRASAELHKVFSFTHSDQRIGQITRLPAALDSSDAEVALLESFHKNTRTAVRKSFKSGFTFEEDDSELALRSIYQIHVENIASVGGIAKPRLFPDALLTTFVYEKHYRAFVAKHGGVIVAGLLVFFFRDTVEYFMPATKPEFRAGQPGSGLIMVAMLNAVRERHSQLWNWGGTWVTQKGVYDFKKKWGAIDVPYSYYSKLSSSVSWDLENAKGFSARFPHFYIAPFPEPAL